MADSGGMRGMRPHPPQLGQIFFERLYFGHCGETANQIRMPFGIIGRTGPGMRQVVGFGDTAKGGKHKPVGKYKPSTNSHFSIAVAHRMQSA